MGGHDGVYQSSRPYVISLACGKKFNGRESTP